MTKVYGIGMDQEITPLMVRDALIECFFQAHCADTGMDQTEGDTNRQYCGEIIKKSFNDIGGDFNNPTKEDVLKVMGKLKEFSAGFRDPSIIEKHSKEIMKLVEKMK